MTSETPRFPGRLGMLPEPEAQFRNEVDTKYAAEAQAHHQAQYPASDCGMGPDAETITGADYSQDSLIESGESWDEGMEFGAGENF